MAERIELPQKGGGTAEEQLEAMYRYLYQMAVAINNNLAEIGGPALTDDEAKIMQRILQGTEEDQQTGGPREAETLKSMIIKTASFIKTAIDEYNLRLIGSVEAEGKLGRYVRKTGLNVDVNPEGIEQRFTFEEVVQGLKTYEINAKNYIKTGLLRTVGGLPVYGVAVGKDIVTFSEDGTETYHDGNKVAEYLADGITFWQNGSMIAKYTGSRISFYYGSNEVFYIQAGKIYCTNDLELSSGKKLIINTENFKIDSTGKVTIKGGGEFSGDLNAAGGTFTGDLNAAGGSFKGTLSAADGTFYGELVAASGTFSGNLDAAGGTFTGDLNAAGGTFTGDLNAAGGSFKGTLSAADGTFYGELVAASGTFSGNLDAAGGTFTGDLNAAGGTFTGDLNAAGGTFTGDLNAAGGTFKGNLQAAGGTFAGTMSAACVTSGTMLADRISGGSLILGGNDNGNGVMIVRNASGIEIGRWDKDGLIAMKGTFGGKLDAASGSFHGDLTCHGQVIDITATDFELSSQMKLLKTGDWTIRNTGLIGEGSTGYVALGKYSVAFTTDSKPITSITMGVPSGELGEFYFSHQNASKDIVGRISFTAGKLGSSEFNRIIAESPQTYQGQKVMLPTKGTLGASNGRWDVYGDKVYYNQMIQGSSREIKRDIRDMENQGERIDRLRPVTFKYKDDPQGQTRQGLILEETREIMPEICSEDGISYMDLVPILLKEVQELRARVSRLEMIAREA